MELATTIKVSARTLNKGQRRALIRVLRYYRNAERYNGVTSVRLSLDKFAGSPLVFAVLETRRKDCHAHSERAVFTRRRAHIRIGARGALKVLAASNGLTDESAHIAHMLDAAV